MIIISRAIHDNRSPMSVEQDAPFRRLRAITPREVVRIYFHTITAGFNFSARHIRWREHMPSRIAIRPPTLRAGLLSASCLQCTTDASCAACLRGRSPLSATILLIAARLEDDGDDVAAFRFAMRPGFTVLYKEAAAFASQGTFAPTYAML